MLKYYLTDKGREAKTGTLELLKNTNRTEILRLMQQRPRLGRIRDAIVETISTRISRSERKKGKWFSSKERNINLVNELRKLMAQGLVERHRR